MSEGLGYDEGAEVALLGAILLRGEAFDVLADRLAPQHFGRHHHGQIFAAMSALHARNQPLDWVSVAAELDTRGELDAVGGKAYLATLTGGVPYRANVEHYAGVIRDKAVLRGVRDLARKMLVEADSERLSGAALLEQAEGLVYALGSQTVSADWLSGRELADALYPAIERLQQTRDGLAGLPSGFAELDRLTRGFQAGDLVILGGRPSQGKSALALQMAMTAAERVPVGLFSVEMSAQQTGLRAVIASAQLDGWRLLSGKLSEIETRRASDGLTTLANAKIWVDESPNLSPLQARSKLRRLAAVAGSVGLVVVDYLQLCAPLPEHRKEPRHVQVAGMSRAWKLLAREFACPFLVLSQLNRASEGRQEKRPTLSDLRESGAIEQDADVVLLVHRPETYEPTNASLQGLAELIIAKQRHGPIGMVDLEFRGPSMTFGRRREQGPYASH